MSSCDFCWIDISSFPGLSFIPGGASWELEGPTAFRCSLWCSSSGQPQQSCDDYKGCCLHWDFSCSFFPMLLSLGPDRCVATALLSSLSTSAMSSRFTCMSVCIRGVPQDLSMVILPHLWRRVPLWCQSVQYNKTGAAVSVTISATWPLYLQASDTCELDCLRVHPGSCLVW